jgi:hypothetical protein
MQHPCLSKLWWSAYYDLPSPVASFNRSLIGPLKLLGSTTLPFCVISSTPFATSLRATPRVCSIFEMEGKGGNTCSYLKCIQHPASPIIWQQNEAGCYPAVFPTMLRQFEPNSLRGTSEGQQLAPGLRLCKIAKMAPSSLTDTCRAKLNA